jgi:hypothetical protein
VGQAWWSCRVERVWWSCSWSEVMTERGGGEGARGGGCSRAWARERDGNNGGGSGRGRGRGRPVWVSEVGVVVGEGVGVVW